MACGLQWCAVVYFCYVWADHDMIMTRQFLPLVVMASVHRSSLCMSLPDQSTIPLASLVSCTLDQPHSNRSQTLNPHGCLSASSLVKTWIEARNKIGKTPQPTSRIHAHITVTGFSRCMCYCKSCMRLNVAGQTDGGFVACSEPACLATPNGHAGPCR